MTPAVTVTIVLFESADVLAGCLASIRDDVDAGYAALVAVDNASPDESATILNREVPAANVLRCADNRGFAAGANQAWPLVETPYWLLLNPDAVLPAGGLRTLVDWMDTHPDIGAASPLIVGRDGEAASPGHPLPSVGRTLLELSRLHRLLTPATRARLLGGPYWQAGDELDVGWVPGTALIVRREAVEAAGLLDASFFMYGEDIEWCWRIGQAGWRIGVCSEVAIQHDEWSSAGRSWRPDEVQYRTATGVTRACAQIRGLRYARLFALATAASIAIEGIHPRRSPAQRRRARIAAQAWWRARAEAEARPAP